MANVKKDHCCKEMRSHLSGREIYLKYDEVCRFYGIDYKKICGGGVQGIFYCPWCGRKLPSDLTDVYFDIIIDQLKLDGPEDQRLPKEFKSDAWWKKRGL